MKVGNTVRYVVKTANGLKIRQATIEKNSR